MDSCDLLFLSWLSEPLTIQLIILGQDTKTCIALLKAHIEITKMRHISVLGIQRSVQVSLFGGLRIFSKCRLFTVFTLSYVPGHANLTVVNLFIQQNVCMYSNFSMFTAAHLFCAEPRCRNGNFAIPAFSMLPLDWLRAGNQAIRSNEKAHGGIQ